MPYCVFVIEKDKDERKTSDIEAEMHDVAILHNIFFSLNTHLTGFFHGLFAAKTDKVIVLDDLGTDKPFFKIGVDDTGTLRCFASAEECPSPYLIAPGRKVDSASDKRL